MLRNYFITAFRYIIRNKIQSFIQIASLAIGITAVILIGLYVENELRYDKFNENLDRIYRLEYGNSAGLPTAIGHEIKEQMPEIENCVRFHPGWSPIKYTDSKGDSPVSDKHLWAGYFLCDSTVFNIFTLPFIQGDPKTALRDPYSVVLTESFARELFGNQDPVGETVEITVNQTGLYNITGIIHDPTNFHLNDFKMLLSMQNLRIWDEFDPKPTGEKRINAYHSNRNFHTYLLMPYHHDKKRTERNINDYFRDKLEGTVTHSEGSVFSMRPLKDIYFTEGLIFDGYRKHGNIKLLRMLLVIALLILFLACINYINLTTARASLRAREVGIRKVAGSLKSKLIGQFLVESVLISLLSFLIAITLAQLLLPTFNQLTMTPLGMAKLFQARNILLSAGCVVLLGIVAGIYPAIYLTSFQPVVSLKRELQTGVKSALFRKLLLTFQFAISVILMIGVITILKQLKYMKTADLGFNKELVLNIVFQGLRNNKFNREVFRQQLLKYPNIKKVAFGPSPFGRLDPANKFLEYNGTSLKIKQTWVDPDYFDLFDIDLLQGRNFSRDMRGDYTTPGAGITEIHLPIRVVINEAARKAYNLGSPIGALLISETLDVAPREIIGVVEDFHFESLHNKIEPCMYVWFKVLSGVNIKISSSDIQRTIKSIEKEYKSMFPDNVFDYQFLDERFENQYENDERLARIISNFAIVALLIGCLGLFGLSSFMAARRTKEIGIRKAMGASVRTVFLLLSREFAVWVTLSVIIACPVAWLVMNKWLQSFAYRTNISWWIFVLVIVIASAIAFITVAWQSLKTARTNPVEALRYE